MANYEVKLSFRVKKGGKTEVRRKVIKNVAALKHQPVDVDFQDDVFQLTYTIDSDTSFQAATEGVKRATEVEKCLSDYGCKLKSAPFVRGWK